jgi:hypothetical protein
MKKIMSHVEDPSSLGVGGVVSSAMQHVWLESWHSSDVDSSSDPHEFLQIPSESVHSSSVATTQISRQHSSVSAAGSVVTEHCLFAGHSMPACSSHVSIESSTSSVQQELNGFTHPYEVSDNMLPPPSRQVSRL